MPEEFEAPLIELEKKIEDLSRQPATPAAAQEMQRLRRALRRASVRPRATARRQRQRKQGHEQHPSRRR